MTAPPTPRDVIVRHIAEALLVGQANLETTPEKAARILADLTRAGFTIVPTALVEEAARYAEDDGTGHHRDLAARPRACVRDGKP